jgi:hypothetical protein
MENNSSNIIFLAWLEFPYFIGAEYESSFPATYNPGVEVNLHVKFRNDLLRVKTSNRWTNSDYREKQIRGLIGGASQMRLDKKDLICGLCALCVLCENALLMVQ